MKKSNIKVGDVQIVIYQEIDQDYLSLTDIARYKNPLESDVSFKIGLGIEIRSTFLAIGKCYIIPILNPSNLTGLESIRLKA